MFRMTVRTADPGKPRAGVAAVGVALDDLLDDRPEQPIEKNRGIGIVSPYLSERRDERSMAADVYTITTMTTHLSTINGKEMTI